MMVGPRARAGHVMGGRATPGQNVRLLTPHSPKLPMHAERPTNHASDALRITYIFSLARLSRERQWGPHGQRQAKHGAARLCALMTNLIRLRYPTADVTVTVEHDPDVSKDRCWVSGDADDPVKMEEDLLLDGDEFTMYADRPEQEFDEAEILRGYVRLTAAYLGDRFAAYLSRLLGALDRPAPLDIDDEYADESTYGTMMCRAADEAEVLRLLDEASTEQLASLSREDVLRAVRLDEENLRLRTLQELHDRRMGRP